jgi:hypothetical protein
MSGEHSGIASALVAALADLSVVETGRTANAGSYSYKYADIGDVVKLTRPKLAEHGLVALTPVRAHEGGLACDVVLLHTSGERLDFGPFPFPHGRDAQATGSMVTYHRRYALIAALGMAAGDDDDGASALPRQEPARASKAKRDEVKHALDQLHPDDQATLKAWWAGHDFGSLRDGSLRADAVEPILDEIANLAAAREHDAPEEVAS